MDLKENKYIPKRLIPAFEKDKLTMESLATTSIKRLIQYRGVGLMLAQRIVDEAARLVNTTKLEESAKLDPPPVGGNVVESGPVSIRVKRIKEANQ